MKILKDFRDRAVRMTEERQAHIAEHPEMRGLEGALAESHTDAAAELLYRFYFGTRVGDKWLCVVVKYAAEDAFVLTAYLTDEPKKGKQVWPIK